MYLHIAQFIPLFYLDWHHCSNLTDLPKAVDNNDIIEHIHIPHYPNLVNILIWTLLKSRFCLDVLYADIIVLTKDSLVGLTERLIKDKKPN